MEKKSYVKCLYIISIICVVVFGIALCKNRINLQSGDKKLAMTYITAPINIPEIMDKQKEIFKANFKNYEVNFVEMNSGTQQIQALVSGDIQVINAIGETAVILASSNGADLKIICMNKRSPRVLTLYTKDESLNTPFSLKGKTIAGPLSTNLYMLLSRYLDTGNMNFVDVKLMNMPIPSAKAALDGGSVDAALLTGISAYKSEMQGYTQICNGENLITSIICVCVTGKFYNENPEIIRKIKLSQSQAADFINNKSGDIVKETSKTQNLSEESINEMIGIFDFTDKATDEYIKELQNTADFMYENKMIENPLDVSKLF